MGDEPGGPASRRDRDRDIEREIADHLELEAESLDADAESGAAARRHARLAFGNPALVAEDTRAVWRRGWVERWRYDLHHAVRSWRRHPGLSLVAVVTMALSIGATTALVGQVNAVFWRPLAVPAAEHLRLLSWSAPRFPYVVGGAMNALAGPASTGGVPSFVSFSYPAYVAMRDAASPSTDLACWGDYGEARPVALGELGFGAVQFVSGNYFATLGVRAQSGRMLQPEDDGGSAHWNPVVVVSDAFWRRALGADPNATEQTLQMNGRRFAVVGVTPPEFPGLDPSTVPDVFAPIGAMIISSQGNAPLANPGVWSICRVVARLAPGASDDEARLAVERALAASIAAAPPAEPYDTPRIALASGAFGTSGLREATATPLTVLIAGVVVLLLAGCANIAGLLLARGQTRGREIATRLALGASRGRVVAQLVTESLVLAVAGGLLGIALAYALSHGARAFLAQFVPLLFGADRTLGVTAALDLRVLAVAVATTAAAGLAFGLGPALGVTRVDLIAAIRRADGGWSARRGSSGRVLVAAQATLAVVLLIASGLLIRTVGNLRTTDLGFAAERLLYARVEPRSGNMPREQRAVYFREALERVARLPGVAAASASTSPPLGSATNVGGEPGGELCWAGQQASGRPPAGAVFNFVAPGYFDTLGARVVAGRDMRWDDESSPTGPGDRRVAVVSEMLARDLVGPEGAPHDLVGAPIHFCDFAEYAMTVVGVVADIKVDGRTAPRSTVYFPLGMVGMPVTLLLRTDVDPAALIATVRRAVTAVNADIPTFSEATLPELRERTLRRERLLAWLVGAFAAVTVAICGLGVYALLAHTVALRRAEIGIRMAMGAAPADVARLVARTSGGAVAVGALIGVIVSLALARLLAGMLFGVSAADPAVIGAALVVVAVVAAVAAALPARAATRVDPLIALRQV